MMPVLQKLGRAMAKYTVVDRKPHDFGIGLDLFPAEIHMITTVDRMDGAGVTDLAAEFGVTKGAVSQQVAKLVKKGLLAKDRDPDNGSRVIVSATELGKQASRNHLEFHRRHDRRFLEYIGGLDAASYATVAEMAEQLDFWMDSYLE